jgi:Fe-S-cluster containining protein
MSVSDTNTVTCLRCGKCCRVEGYVRLREGEAERLAGFLGMEVAAFTARYTRLTCDRGALSLTERTDGACVFFDERAGCTVNTVKPDQCRGFPARWRFADAERICAGLAADNGERD